MSALLKPLIGGKAWATIQAHCALVGMVLSVVEGADAHVIAIDRAGKSHRIDTVEQLEGVMLAVGRHYRARHPVRTEDAGDELMRSFSRPFGGQRVEPEPVLRGLKALNAADDLIASISF